MAFGKKSTTKVAPSSYPKIPFHALRTAQLSSAIVVGAIMFYFVYHLTHDHWHIPWTFIFFTVASLLTILGLSITIVMHCCIGLNPRLNLAINSGLFLLWGAGFGMLWWWASKTLFNICDAKNLGDGAGIMVCRIYKALFAFGMLGFASTVMALLLDIYVFKRATRLGKYNNMLDTDNKRAFHDNGGELSGYNARDHQRSAEAAYPVAEQLSAYDTSYRGPSH